MLWKSLQSIIVRAYYHHKFMYCQFVFFKTIDKANKNVYFFFGWGSFGLTKKGNLVSIYTIMVKSYKAKGSPL